MTAKDIEELATNAVKKSLLTSGFLSPYITENDKGPSWDGFVHLHASQKKTKKDYSGRVPVQVKGKCCQELSREQISFQVDTDDLKTYACDGGVMYFVVYITPDGSGEQIYYAPLTPDILEALLRRCPEGQRTKSITLNRFPKDPQEKTRIFREFGKLYKTKPQSALTPVTPALPSYWQGTAGVLSEDRLLDRLTETGIHILDLRHGNQIPQIVRRLREERGQAVCAFPFDELMDQVVQVIRSCPMDMEKALAEHLAKHGGILVFRDLDLLRGRPATEKTVCETVAALAEGRSVVVSGSRLEEQVPGLMKAFRDREYYQICG